MQQIIRLQPSNIPTSSSRKIISNLESTNFSFYENNSPCRTSAETLGILKTAYLHNRERLAQTDRQLSRLHRIANDDRLETGSRHLVAEHEIELRAGCTRLQPVATFEM